MMLALSLFNSSLLGLNISAQCPEFLFIFVEAKCNINYIASLDILSYVILGMKIDVSCVFRPAIFSLLFFFSLSICRCPWQIRKAHLKWNFTQFSITLITTHTHTSIVESPLETSAGFPRRRAEEISAHLTPSLCSWPPCARARTPQI